MFNKILVREGEREGRRLLGKREEGRGKREEGRGKREEGRGKGEGGRKGKGEGECWDLVQEGVSQYDDIGFCPDLTIILGEK